MHKSTIWVAILVGISATSAAFADGRMVDDTTIASVAVNGGSDTQNPGTTCLRISSPVVAACTGTFVAIPNNNRQLIAAALASKASGSKVLLYYDDSGSPYHCPGHVFTPCSVISIETK